MVQISRAALCLTVACYAAATSFTVAAIDGNTTATAPVPVAPITNATAPEMEKAGIEWVNLDQCEIMFLYWEHDESATFDINYVHSQGVDRTSERFHDDPWPIQTSNTERINGFLSLIQIYPRQDMVCISEIKIECGWHAIAYGEYGESRTVVITADAIQESWIRKTGGLRKPVNWANDPCLYFRNAGWDKGAFRAMDIYRSVFECGDDYMCIAGRIETFSH